LGQGGQPQTDAADGPVGVRLGDGEREAGALGQAAALAVDPVLSLLSVRVGGQASDQGTYESVASSLTMDTSRSENARRTTGL
jgi:hypothetical protein